MPQVEGRGHGDRGVDRVPDSDRHDLTLIVDVDRESVTLVRPELFVVEQIANQAEARLTAGTSPPGPVHQVVDVGHGVLQADSILRGLWTSAMSGDQDRDQPFPMHGRQTVDEISGEGEWSHFQPFVLRASSPFIPAAAR